MRKVAVIGKCSNTRSDAPLDNPEWEIWGLAWDPLPVCHRYFELHENWTNFLGNPEDAEAHRRWMMGQSVPVYMLKKEPEIPPSIAYPMEEVADLVGRTCFGTPYLESSIAYMFALAMLEGVERIGVWGCDLATGGEYAYQRPNMEYLIGLARGRGINVYVPPRNTLLSPMREVPYGFDDPNAGKPQIRPFWMPQKEEQTL